MRRGHVEFRHRFGVRGACLFLLAERQVRSASELARIPDGALVRACGIVVMRQQPETANGTIFVTLEDETGSVNVIVWKRVREMYRVPLLSPSLAAWLGTFGELFFPALLICGLFTRAAALGLFAVNAFAVVSYWHVLGKPGFEAALGQHVLWGFMITVIAIFGAGAISLDRLSGGRQHH